MLFIFMTCLIGLYITGDFNCCRISQHSQRSGFAIVDQLVSLIPKFTYSLHVCVTVWQILHSSVFMCDAHHNLYIYIFFYQANVRDVYVSLSGPDGQALKWDLTKR